MTKAKVSQMVLIATISTILLIICIMIIPFFDSATKETFALSSSTTYYKNGSSFYTLSSSEQHYKCTNSRHSESNDYTYSNVSGTCYSDSDWRVCGNCEGEGYLPWAESVCYACGGEGGEYVYTNYNHSITPSYILYTYTNIDTGATATSQSAYSTASGYTVSFNNNGGSGSMSSQYFLHGHSQALKSNSFTRTYYKFLGWSTSSTATSATYTNGQAVTSVTTGSSITLYAVWEAETYTVAYNGNGNTGGSTASSTHSIGVAKNLTTNGFTKTGYHFAGWATSSNGAVVYGDGESVTNLTTEGGATLTLYAKWTINNYQLTINPNGGEMDFVNYMELPNLDSDISSEGHELNYTYSASEKKWTFTATSYVDPWAILQPKVYLEAGVTYYIRMTLTDANGEYFVTPKAVQLHYAINSVWEYENSVYFSGESTNPLTVDTSGTYDFRFDYDAKESVICMTNFVIYTAGTKVTDSQTVSLNYGDEYRLPQCTKQYASLAGWSTSTTGEVLYEDGEKIKNLTAVNGGAVTLYAIWTPAVYYVIYDGNSSTGGSTANSRHVYDVPSALTTNGFTKTGYTFAGWSTTNWGLIEYGDGATVINLADTDGTAVTLYAKWSPITYNVTLEPNGGEFEFLDALELSNMNNDISYNGHELNYTYSASENKWTFTATSYGDPYAKLQCSVYLEAGVTYYMRMTLTDENGVTVVTPGVVQMHYAINSAWDAAKSRYFSGEQTESFTVGTSGTYDFRFDYNGKVPVICMSNLFIYTNSSQTTDAFTVSVDYQEYYTLPLGNKIGHNLSGWSTTADGEVLYKNRERVKNLTAVNGGNVTLFAIWAPIQYTIQYDGNGATSGSMANSVHTYGVAKNLSANQYEREFFQFVGWTLEAGGEVVYQDCESVINLREKSELIILYAKWDIIARTLNIDPGYGIVAKDSLIDVASIPNKDLTLTNTVTGNYSASEGKWTFRGNSSDPYVVLPYYAYLQAGTTYYMHMTITDTSGNLITTTNIVQMHYAISRAWSGGNSKMFTGDMTCSFTVSTTGTYGFRFDYNDTNITLCMSNFYIYSQTTGSSIAVDANKNAYYQLPIPTRTGFTFVGWQTQGIDSIIGNMLKMQDTEAFVTALWRLDSTAFFAGNGGQITVLGFDTTDSAGTVTVEATAYDGYKFLSWALSDGADMSSYTSTKITLPISLVQYKIVIANFAVVGESTPLTTFGGINNSIVVTTNVGGKLRVLGYDNTNTISTVRYAINNINPNYKFVGWRILGSETIISTNETVEFAVADYIGKILIADFQPKENSNINWDTNN